MEREKTSGGFGFINFKWDLPSYTLMMFLMIIKVEETYQSLAGKVVLFPTGSGAKQATYRC
ncbi:hypothetical protein EL17_11010 [Anditalea andensis]|uniref:Uncharacterized protein n=1 Tax=Anditalea andensis TaxID=1048983 RepID=A0A074KXK4_9BACT|nr:hypothetical protein EL17_11010 [Anditalea andensis]